MSALQGKLASLQWHQDCAHSNFLRKTKTTLLIRGQWNLTNMTVVFVLTNLRLHRYHYELQNHWFFMWQNYNLRAKVVDEFAHIFVFEYITMYSINNSRNDILQLFFSSFFYPRLWPNGYQLWHSSKTHSQRLRQVAGSSPVNGRRKVHGAFWFREKSHGFSPKSFGQNAIMPTTGSTSISTAFSQYSFPTDPRGMNPALLLLLRWVSYIIIRQK